jgi:hypothetical protein
MDWARKRPKCPYLISTLIYLFFTDRWDPHKGHLQPHTSPATPSPSSYPRRAKRRRCPRTPVGELRLREAKRQRPAPDEIHPRVGEGQAPPASPNAGRRAPPRGGQAATTAPNDASGVPERRSVSSAQGRPSGSGGSRRDPPTGWGEAKRRQLRLRGARRQLRPQRSLLARGKGGGPVSAAPGSEQRRAPSERGPQGRAAATRSVRSCSPRESSGNLRVEVEDDPYMWVHMAVVEGRRAGTKTGFFWSFPSQSMLTLMI